MIYRFFLPLQSCILSFFLMAGLGVHGQINKDKVPYYTIDQKRLLVLSAGNFIFGVSQGQFEVDSAYLFASNMYGQSRLLVYNEQYSDGTPTAGSLLIDQGDIRGAKELLATLSGKDRIRLLLDLGVYYTFKAGTVSEDLDSALYFLEEALALSETLRDNSLAMAARNILGRLFFQKRDLQKSQQYLVSVVNHYRLGGKKKELAQALQMQAIHLPFSDSMRLQLLDQSLTLFTNLKSIDKQMEVLTHIATFKFFMNWNNAAGDLERLLELEHASGFRHTQYTLNVLAYICEARADYIIGQKYSEQSLDVIDTLQDHELASVFYLRSASFFLRFDKRSKAVELFERILKKDLNPKTQIFWYSCVLVMTESLINYGQAQRALHLIDSIAEKVPPYYTRDKISMAIERAQAYAKLGNNVEAEKQYELWKSYSESSPVEFEHSEVPHGWVRMAEYYFKVGNFSKSKQSLEKAFAYKDKFAVPTSLNYYQIKYALDSLDGNLRAAVEDLKLFKLYDDSIRNLHHLGLLDELQMEYQTIKKDKDIQILQGVLKEGVYQRNMIFAGAIGLFVITTLLFALYRSKQKRNVLLESQKNEINNKNATLTSLLQEKEWLLKEVHHRVKNNLQTVVSLLEVQSEFLQGGALLAIEDSQHRIYAMSLIHQKLYQTESVGTINVENYLPELIQYLKDSFNVSHRIGFDLQIDPIELDVAQAVPVGLILNEAITNTIKYAFPTRKNSNRVSVKMMRLENDLTQFTIADNGIGLPTDFDSSNSARLGLKLMKGLTDDLGGTFAITSENGTRINIQFELNPLLHEFGKKGVVEEIAEG